MSNHLTTPIQSSFNSGVDKKINDSNQILPQQLPCHVVSVVGSIVTVSFDISSGYTLPQVTMPVVGFQYIRYPIKIGDAGVALSASANISGQTGLGAGTANLSLQANLASLVFIPLGNINWFSVDPNALNFYGQNGVVIFDTEMNSIITLTPTSITIVGENSVTINSGGTNVSVNSNGSFNIYGTGNGSIYAGGGLVLGDGANSATISNMHTVFAQMISWMNSHTHTVVGGSGGEAVATDTPYTGGNPIT
jgi:hypothetical protein